MFLSRIYNYSRILSQNVTCGNKVPSKLIKSSIKPFHLSYTWKVAEGNDTESEVIKDPTEANVRDPSKDRTKIIPVETSIRYLQSKAYAETYGADPVWKLYRRNHKGPRAPRKTRESCIRKGCISTGNPCPICRDEYLVLKAENTNLLKQFISPYTGETLSYSVTGICQKRHKELLVAIEIAKDKGLIEFDVPFREYDYSLYKN